MNRTILAAGTLLRREFVRFFRQKSRVIGAAVPPLLFWILMGSGLGHAVPQMNNLNVLQYYFPGMILMIVLFTSIFSTISIIEDRRDGFLQSVLVAPVPRISIVLGNILGGTFVAFLQGAFFILLAPFLHIHFNGTSFLATLGMLFLTSFGLTGLGFWIAWKMDSTQGFHAIMNLFLMPLWFLSGSLFPLEGSPRWLYVIMKWNPLTYSVSFLRAEYFSKHLMDPSLPSPAFSIFVILIFDGIVLIASTIACNKSHQ